MRARLERWRTLLTLELALALLVVAVGAGVGYQYQQTQRLGDERTRLEAEVTNVQDQLRSYRREHDVAALREELRQLQSNPATTGLPSRQEALQVGTALSSDASSRGVEVVAFAAADTTVPAGEGKTVPGMQLSLTARGTFERLAELLALTDGAQAARVQKLTLSQDQEDQANWLMKLTVVIPYQKER